MNADPIIAHVVFVDGARRPVYLEASDKQYFIDDEGEKVHGVASGGLITKIPISQ